MFRAEEYLGIRWAVPCDPPDTMDCWELVRWARRDMGLLTPAYSDPAERDEDTLRAFLDDPPPGWFRTSHPRQGDVAAFGTDHAHVGVFVAPAFILHSAPVGRGTPVSRIDRSRVLLRLYKHMEVYRYATDHR